MLIAVDARSFAAEAGDGAAPIVREVRFVYLDTATGAETPVDSPSPQWFAGQTRLRVGGRYSPEVANEDLARFITKHRLLCREVRPEPVAGGVRVVFVFERRERVWAVKVAAAKGAPSVKATELMEQAVKLRRDAPVSLAAVNADRWAVIAYLRRDGYHFATVDARVDAVEARAGYSNVTFEVDRGPKVQPDAIIITGNSTLTRKQLLAEMRTKEDGWFSSRRFVQSTYQADVENTKRRYLAAGWEDVEVTAKPVLFDTEPVSLRVRYAERNGKSVVTTVSVRGSKTLGNRSVRRQLLCQKGSEFTREKFDQDLQQLKARYYSAGLRAEPEDVVVKDAAPGARKGELSADLLFARARETVVIDVAIRQEKDAGRAVAIVDKVTCETTGPHANNHVAGLMKQVRPGAAFTQDALLQDVAAISRFYTRPGADLRHALIDERYTPTPAGYRVRMDFIRRGSGTGSVAATIRIRVNEGGRYFVESVTFAGVTAGKFMTRRTFEEHLRDRLRMKKGSLFTRTDLAADLQAIRTAYQEKGHADVQVKLDEARMVRPGEKTYDLAYVIVEGPLYTVDIIRPRGNDKTRPDVITREMAIKPGERFDIRKINESERRLRNTRHFSKVDVRPAASKRPPEDGQHFKELHVHVQETSTRRIMIGAGASSSAGVFGDIRYQDGNFDLGDPARSWADFVSGTAFAGGGQALSIFLRPGSDMTQFGVQWREPWLNERAVELGVTAGFYSRQWDEYTVEKLGGSVTLGKRYRPNLTGFVGIREHLVDVTDVDATAPKEIWDDEGTYGVVGVFTGITHDTVDNRGFPTSGKKWTLTTELVGSSDFTIVKLLAEGRWFCPVYEAPDKSRHVFSLWGNAGTIVGSDPAVFEKFFAGGLGSVRGFQSQGISPTSNKIYVAPPNGPVVAVKNGEPIGGMFEIEGGAEYYFPIVKQKARGVIFLDAGSVAENSLGIGSALSDLRVAAGIGVQFVIPALGNAPIALYLGVPLMKEDDDETEILTFSIGVFLP